MGGKQNTTKVGCSREGMLETESSERVRSKAQLELWKESGAGGQHSNH